MANQCTKFEVSGFNDSGDILGEIMHLNGSRDHNHAPFGGGFHLLVRLDIAYQCTKFDSSGLSHSLDIDGDPKFTSTSANADGPRDAALQKIDNVMHSELGLPPVPFLTGRPVFQPICPASRWTSKRDVKCPVF